MKNNKGFTLTEILLAAMIVGLIGVALAGLTTAAVRESGIARTRTMLRQQLSTAMRQLRQDVQQATSAQIKDSGRTLVLEYTPAYSAGPKLWEGAQTPTTVTYSFSPGTVGGEGGGKTGGVYRRYPDGVQEVWLTNVKSISSGSFASPRFLIPSEVSGSGNICSSGTKCSLLQVQIILEVPTSPVVNETVQETFVLPSGVIL